MVKRTRIRVGVMLVVLLLMPLAACRGDDSPDGKEAQKTVEGEKAAEADSAVVGSFVGEVSGTEAFVAVVAAPAEGGRTPAPYRSTSPTAKA
jgi:hypothetical protein